MLASEMKNRDVAVIGPYVDNNLRAWFGRVIFKRNNRYWLVTPQLDPNDPSEVLLDWPDMDFEVSLTRLMLM